MQANHLGAAPSRPGRLAARGGVSDVRPAASIEQRPLPSRDDAKSMRNGSRQLDSVPGSLNPAATFRADRPAALDRRSWSGSPVQRRAERIDSAVGACRRPQLAYPRHAWAKSRNGEAAAGDPGVPRDRRRSVLAIRATRRQAAGGRRLLLHFAAVEFEPDGDAEGSRPGSSAGPTGGAPTKCSASGRSARARRLAFTDHPVERASSIAVIALLDAAGAVDLAMNRRRRPPMLVSRAARSPDLATPAEVARKPTPISRAKCRQGRLPRPGGPKNSTWSSGSPRDWRHC